MKYFHILLLITLISSFSIRSMDMVNQEEKEKFISYLWNNFYIKEKARKKPECLRDAARFGNLQATIYYLWDNPTDEDLEVALRLSASCPSYQTFRILFEKIVKKNGIAKALEIARSRAWESCKYGSFCEGGRITAFIIKTTSPSSNMLTQCLDTSIENCDYDRVRILLNSGATTSKKYMNSEIKKIMKNHTKNSKNPTLKNICLRFILRNRDLFSGDTFKTLPQEAIEYS